MKITGEITPEAIRDAEQKLVGYQKLRAWGGTSGMYHTVTRDEMLKLRPAVRVKKGKTDWAKYRSTYNKDEAYRLIARVTKKYGISGAYVGLAANRMPEIFNVFYPSIQGEMTSLEYNRKNASVLKAFDPLVEYAYRNEAPYRIHFQTLYGDIVQYMQETYTRYSIVDFDGMAYLTPERAEEYAKAIAHCVSSRALVAVWHTYGHRNMLEAPVDEKARPTLIKNLLACGLEIEEYLPLKYYDTSPMKVDVFVVARKAA